MQTGVQTTTVKNNNNNNNNTPSGNLFDRLNDRNGTLLPAESIYRTFGQILIAMKGLHGNHPPITHRDLKLENILFGTVSKTI